MENKMYNEKGILRPEYETDIERQTISFKDDKDKVDIRTDFGKGDGYKSVDGHHYASMEDAEIANKLYYDRMMTNNQHYAELERAYFDCITPNFDINDKDMLQQALAAQQEIFSTYINKRYGSYLSELLEQYDYGQQDNNRSPKR